MFCQRKTALSRWVGSLGVLACLLVLPDPAPAQVSIFEDGFESGSTCRWATAPDANCPPIFPGIVLAVASDMNEISVAWLGATDDSTPTNLIGYQIHVSEEPDFEPGPSTLAATFKGTTEGVVPGLLPETTYYVLILAEDREGITSLERESSIVTTPAFPVIPGETGLQQAEDLNLGEPTDVTDTSLTFARTPGAQPPRPGALLAGQVGSGGYLRAVTSVDVTSDEIVVQTQDATLADAVEQISISSSQTLSDIADVDGVELSFAEDRATMRLSSVQHQRSGSVQESSLRWIAEQTDFTLQRDGARRPLVETSDVTLGANISFEPEFRLGGSWSLVGGIESGYAIARGTLGLNATARYDFSGASTFEPPPIRLLRRTWFAYYQVGGVPVLQRITLDVQAAISATASTEINATATANASATVEVGVRYNPGSGSWEPVSSVDFARSLSARLDVEGGVEAEVRVIPRLTVETYEALAGSVSVEPSINGSITVINTAAPRCAPLELSGFDFALDVDCFVDLDLTAFNLNFSLVDNLRVCGPLSYPLFDLPQVALSSTGSGSAEDPVVITADVTDGMNNPFSPSAGEWEVAPTSGQLDVTSTSPPSANFTCGADPSYTIGFSGHGRLGEAARRCFEIEQMCSDQCMTGTWVDNFGFLWTLVQTGSSITGVVTFNSCGTSRDVTGTFDGSSITLTATGASSECCDFTYSGTISDCSTGSGTWVQFPGGEGCTGSGTWSMTRTSLLDELPPEDSTLTVTPARVAGSP